jgi:DNA-binding LacI/PurR family transcriptional regulator
VVESSRLSVVREEVVVDIADVAREASLSTASVSRALRGLPGVSPENRRRIAEVARRLGYVPSANAAGLATGRTRTVAAIVPHLARWSCGEMVRGVEEAVSAAGYDVLLYQVAGSRAARQRLLRTTLLSKRADAVLVLGLRLSAEECRGVTRIGRPVAVVGLGANAGPGPDADESATWLATSHLIDLGHRRVGYAGGGRDALAFAAPVARLAGYRAALLARNIRPDPSLETRGPSRGAGGAEAGRQLLSRPDRPTAVVAASDEMAVGVLRAARELGLAVPEDLSVIGIDDHGLGAYLDLTTVEHRAREVGRRAAEEVLAELAGVRSRPGRALNIELVNRSSTGPLAGA